MQAVPPPPPVVMSRSQAASFFSKYPVVTQQGVHYRLLGFNLTGKRDALDAAKAKLAAEGWSSDFMRDRSGVEVLSVNTGGKTAEQAMQLASRLRAHEFGSADVQPFAVPDTVK